MIGDSYFQLRAQIGTTLFSLAKLAREFAAPDAKLAALQTLQTRLREPFLFVAIGERGSGKSALLNALFGREFTGDPAYAGHSTIYRYGAEPRDRTGNDGVIEAQRPYVFLRDFTLAEVPDWESAGQASHLLDAADLTLVVLPAKGDATATWDALAARDREARQKWVLVMQGCDAVPVAELPRIVKQTRHFMLTRLDATCSLFPVSARTRHGTEALEHYIDAEVVAAEPRSIKLRELCRAGRAILDGMSAVPRAALRSAWHRAERADEERAALETRRHESMRGADGAVWTLTGLFDSTQRRAATLLRRKLSPTGIWRDSDAWWDEFRAESETRAHDAICRNLAHAAEKFDSDLRQSWQHHRKVLRELDGATKPPFEHRGPAIFATLESNLASVRPEGEMTAAVRRVCDAARRRLRPPALAAAGAVICVLAAASFRQLLPVATGALVITAIVLMIALARAHGTVLAELRLQMNARREHVLGRFDEEVKFEIQRFYEVLAACFGPLKETALHEHAALTVQIQRLQELEAAFDRCAAGIETRGAKQLATSG